jgi:hypothetical protein
MTLTPSDILIVAALVPAAYFSISYGALSPWYRAPLGWVIFLYSLAVVALLALIAYAVVFEVRVAEPARTLVAGGLLATLTAKVVILHVERRAGTLARRGTPKREKVHDD